MLRDLGTVLALTGQSKARAQRPGFFGGRLQQRVFRESICSDLIRGWMRVLRSETAQNQVSHAAGLNSFDALALIGSTVSVATFCDSSASSLP
jgi:hypothetical protein